MDALDALLLKVAERAAYFTQDRFGIISYSLARWCFYLVGASIIAYWGLRYFDETPAARLFGSGILSIVIDAGFLLIISRETEYLKNAIDAWGKGNIYPPSRFAASAGLRVIVFILCCLTLIAAVLAVFTQKPREAMNLVAEVEMISILFGLYFANVVPRPPMRKTEPLRRRNGLIKQI